MYKRQARALEPEVPGYISVVLSAALRMDPGSRIQNVPELMGALTSQRAADSITPPQRQPERSAVREQHISISTRTLLTGSLLVIVVLFFLPVSYTHLDVYKRQKLHAACVKYVSAKGQNRALAAIEDQILSLIHI